MLFNSLEFLIFLLFIFIVFHCLKNNESKKGVLVIGSLFFYGWWKLEYVPIIIGSILVNYLFASGILRKRMSGDNIKNILVLGIIFNLFLLGVFKYTDFFIATVNDISGSQFAALGIALPLAISFFTFQQIAYLSDVATGKVSRVKLLDYFLFVSFFPQLIAGPIVHHSEMMPQFKKVFKKPKVELNLMIGLSIFVIGLAKKILFADNLAPYADYVFDAAEAGVQITFFKAWSGALAYSLQLYFDFSGYSDMAIGIARMFGIKLPLNFYSPYKATSIIDFWKRWHMTLSRFLRDYLYIPLGGSRKGISHKYLNIVITMLLGGLWHGAGWTFVIWGALHGVYISINHVFRSFTRNMSIPLIISRPLGIFVTFTMVLIGWVIFRSESISSAMIILHGMSGLNGVLIPNMILQLIMPFIPWLSEIGIEVVHGDPGIAIIEFLFIFSGLTIVMMLPNVYEMFWRYQPTIHTNEIPKQFSEEKILLPIRKTLIWRPLAITALFYALVLTMTILVGIGIESPFLYFQF